MIFNHVKQLKADGKRIGITFSTFDMLHAGHIAMLSEAKNHCDYLIAGLQTDPTIDRPEKNKPIQTLEEREIQVRSCRYIDYYFIYDTEQSLYDSIKKLSPNIRFLGDDYLGKKFTGDDLPVEIRYHPRSAHTYSTTNLRKIISEREILKNKK